MTIYIYELIYSYIQYIYIDPSEKKTLYCTCFFAIICYWLCQLNVTTDRSMPTSKNFSAVQIYVN